MTDKMTIRTFPTAYKLKAIKRGDCGRRAADLPLSAICHHRAAYDALNRPTPAGDDALPARYASV